MSLLSGSWFSTKNISRILSQSRKTCLVSQKEPIRRVSLNLHRAYEHINGAVFCTVLVWPCCFLFDCCIAWKAKEPLTTYIAYTIKLTMGASKKYKVKLPGFKYIISVSFKNIEKRNSYKEVPQGVNCIEGHYFFLSEMSRRSLNPYLRGQDVLF